MVAGKPATINIGSDAMATLDANLKGQIYEPKIYYSLPPSNPTPEWIIFKGNKGIDSITTMAAATVTTLNDLEITFAAGSDIDLPFKINPQVFMSNFALDFELDLEPDNPHYEASNGSMLWMMYELISVS
jgi:hypothetical protein